MGRHTGIPVRDQAGVGAYGREDTQDGRLGAHPADKEEFPRIVALMLTALEDPNYLTKVLIAGAAGYVLKHESGPQVTEAVQKVLGGEVRFDQEVATRLLA